MTTATHDELRNEVRRRYAAAAVAASTTNGSGSGCGTRSTDAADACCAATESAGCCTRGPYSVDVVEPFGARLYGVCERDELPAQALAASLGCGNPIAVADLRPGERVLDLGSGGGIDVLLSARRVGRTGFAYGVDMTDEMLDLARSNATRAGVDNVEFVRGTIEHVPLPDGVVDVIISNCVLNLSVDKAAVLSEMFRLLVAGGRIGISDVVADDDLTSADRAERGSYVGCIAGALSRREYLDGLADVGFVDATVAYTHEAARGMHAATVRATKPVTN